MRVENNQTVELQNVSAGTVVYNPLSNFYYLVTDESTDQSVTCVNLYTGQLVLYERECKVRQYPQSYVVLESDK